MCNNKGTLVIDNTILHCSNSGVIFCWKLVSNLYQTVIYYSIPEWRCFDWRRSAGDFQPWQLLKSWAFFRSFAKRSLRVSSSPLSFVDFWRISSCSNLRESALPVKPKQQRKTEVREWPHLIKDTQYCSTHHSSQSSRSYTVISRVLPPFQYQNPNLKLNHHRPLL